jgi:hypothetical protein
MHAGTPVSFELDGKIYRLRFTLRVLKELEEQHQISVLRSPEAMVESMRDPRKLALVLYHGMKVYDPEVTLDWVEDTFDISMMTALAPLIAQAITGQKSGQSPNPPGPGKANGIGLPSGPLEDTISASPPANSGVLT